MWPVLVMFGLQLLSLGIAMEQHGKPKTGNESVVASIIALIINNALLYWGGWFDVLSK